MHGISPSVLNCGNTYSSSTIYLPQFPARRDGAQQAGPSRRRRLHHVRDAVHGHAGLHDGPTLLPARLAELHRRD